MKSPIQNPFLTLGLIAFVLLWTIGWVSLSAAPETKIVPSKKDRILRDLGRVLKNQKRILEKIEKLEARLSDAEAGEAGSG